MPIFTIVATCGGETQTATFEVPIEPPARITVIVDDTSQDPTAIITITTPPEVTEVVVDFGDGTPPVAVPVEDGHAQVEHTYDTNGTYEITVSAPAHPDVESGTGTAVIDHAGPRQLVVDATVTDDPTVTVVVTAPPGVPTATVTLGDGTTIPVTFADGRASFLHTYAANGDFTITATTTTPDVLPGSDTVTITQGGPTAATLTLVADAGDDPRVGFTITIDEPSLVSEVFLSTGVPGMPLVTIPTGGQSTITYGPVEIPSDGVWTASVNASNAIGDTDTYTVTNAANQITVDVVDDSDPTFTFEIHGGAQDATQYTLALGDGTTVTVPRSSTTGSGTYTYTYAVNGPKTVIASAVDSLPGQTTVNVTQATGALTLAADTTGDPNVVFTATAPPGVTEVTFDFGDGSPTVSVPVTGGIASTTHTYAINGTFTASVSAPHVQGASTDVTIAGADMRIRWEIVPTLDPGSPGQSRFRVWFPTTTLSASTINFGDGNTHTIGAGVRDASGNWPYNSNGTYTVTLTNPDWPVDPPSITITIDTAIDLVVTGQPAMTVSASATARLGFHAAAQTVRFTWGDGTSTTVPVTGTTVTAGHTYATPGTYTVEATAVASGRDEQTITVEAPELALTADTAMDPAVHFTITVPPAVPEVTLTTGIPRQPAIVIPTNGQSEITYIVDDVPITGTWTAVVTAPSLPAASAEYLIEGAANTLDVHVTNNDPHVIVTVPLINQDASEMSIDWGDGTVDYWPVVDYQSQAEHTYAQNGDYMVGVDVWISIPATVDVTINNASSSPARFVLRADATRDPIARIWAEELPDNVDAVTIEWGDGQTEVLTRAQHFAATHEYDGNGDYTVVAYGPGLERVQTTFNIGDAEDTVVVSWARRAADHLAFYQATGLPDTDSVARIEWGDGERTDVPATDGKAGTLTPPPTATHIYAPGGTYRARVVSLPSGRTSASLIVVTPSPPIDLVIEADTSADPIVSVAVGGYPADAATGTIDWGDGTPARSYDIADQVLVASHTYLADGDYTVTAAYGPASSVVSLTIQRA